MHGDVQEKNKINYGQIIDNKMKILYNVHNRYFISKKERVI